MRQTPRPHAPVLEQPVRRRLSGTIAILSVATLVAVGAWQLSKDGSFWVDEASIAKSLLELSPTELFGRLIGEQSFPRWLLLCIQAATSLFGYETMVARALPHFFFVLANVTWGRLLYLRFRDEPLLIGVGSLLLMVPSSWFIYGAMLKPYSADVFLAMIPFLLPDAFYTRTLARGERPFRLLALTVPVALSYPYALALMARAGGWWIQRAVRGEPAVALRGAGLGLAGLAIFEACLWWTDLRHTAGVSESLQGFWGRCIIGSSEVGTLDLLDRFAVGWWTGATEFSDRARLPGPMVAVLRMAICVGLAQLALQLRPRPDSAERESARLDDDWGSRSLGCGVLLTGLPFASLVFDYPICAGRLTLFSLLPLVLITLEGFDFVARLARRLPFGSWIAVALGAALVLGIAPTSLRETRRLAAAPAPGDLRPWIDKMRTRPELPVLSNGCTRKQITTLPEGLPVPVLWLDKGGGMELAVRQEREAWLLIARSANCPGTVRKVRRKAAGLAPQHEARDDVYLFHVRLKDLP